LRTRSPASINCGRSPARVTATSCTSAGSASEHRPSRPHNAGPDDIMPPVKAVQIVRESGPDESLELVELPEPEASHALSPGAAGGVGTAALQVAHGLGARTIALVSSEEKAAVARRAGADDVLQVGDGWKDEVREVSGGGVDLVLDPVGGDRFTDSLRALRED